MKIARRHIILGLLLFAALVMIGLFMLTNSNARVNPGSIFPESADSTRPAIDIQPPGRIPNNGAGNEGLLPTADTSKHNNLLNTIDQKIANNKGKKGSANTNTPGAKKSSPHSEIA